MTKEAMLVKLESDSDFYALLKSVERNGVLEPGIAVFTDKGLELRVGFRRYCCLERLYAGDGEMPVYILPNDVTEQEINEIMSFKEGSLQIPWPEYNKWVHLRNNDAKAVNQVTGCTKKEIEVRFAAVDMCQDYLESFPDAEAPWSIFTKAIRHKREKCKLEEVINANPALKVKVFEQINSKNVKDAQATKLNDVLTAPRAKETFLTDGFEAAVKRLSKKDSDVESTVARYLKPLLAINPDKLIESASRSTALRDQIEELRDILDRCLPKDG